MRHKPPSKRKPETAPVDENIERRRGRMSAGATMPAIAKGARTLTQKAITRTSTIVDPGGRRRETSGDVRHGRRHL